MFKSEYEIKKTFKNLIFSKLSDTNIISLSFVGSFTGKKKLSEINDIDLIIIVKNLNSKNLSKIKNQIKKIKISNYFKDKKKIYINDTFGPLKFKNKNNLVIHLMVYDIDGHKKHVIESPFTVFDWERSNKYKYKKMSEVLTVGNLQLRDFIKSRRGVNDYISDINKKSISYRYYSFNKEKYFLVKKKYKIKDKDKLEFYYHIVKNLINNFLKFKKQKNEILNLKKFGFEIKKNFSYDFYKKHFKNINILINQKVKIKLNNPKNFNNWIKKFLKDFQYQINYEVSNSKKIIFVRHLKTKLNDNSFLGQYRDPSILKNKTKIKKKNFSIVFSSPLKRSIETAKKFSNNKIITDKNLMEINYGQAEGLNINDLKIKFPYILQKWKKKQDPKFPNGENYRNVIKRQNIFLRKIINLNHKQICVVTHNVFLRCLIGKFFNFPINKWHKLEIPHGLKLEFLIINKKIYPNINRNILKAIIKNF